MMKKGIALLALILSLGLPMAAQANLIGILPTTAGGTDYQAYYDTSSNLTWLADANVKGPMTWSHATSWASGLTITGYVGGTQKTVSGWRLPTTTQPDSSCGSQDTLSGYPDQGYGFNCTGSEMGNLFYNVLGGTAEHSINTTHNNKTYSLFTNIQSRVYWSATEYAPITVYAWYFDFDGGFQGSGSKTGSLYAWAVRSGDPGAAATSVPAPGSLWLMGAGLALLGLMLGRRRLALR